MLPDPIHPLVVHFPIVLSVALPISALWALWTISRGTPHRRAWFIPVMFAGLLTASSYLALETGESQEDRIEAVVGDKPLHTHEEAAEVFLFLSAGAAILMAAGLLGGAPGKGTRILGTLTTAVLLMAGARVGASGGKLVYEHGAAQAYVADPTPASLGSTGSPSYTPRSSGPRAMSESGDGHGGNLDGFETEDRSGEGRS